MSRAPRLSLSVMERSESVPEHSGTDLISSNPRPKFRFVQTTPGVRQPPGTLAHSRSARIVPVQMGSR
eukprot:2009996-Pyramimonas_sp.AAC.2